MQLPGTTDILARTALRSPHAPCLVDGGVSLSYAEMDARVERTAAFLWHHGARPGTRVAWLLQAGVQLVEVVHALVRLGAVSVPLSHRLTPPEVAFQTADCTVALVLAHESLAGSASLVTAPRLSIPLESGGKDPLTDHDLSPAPVHTGAASDIHSILYTSGTTGRPKGAMLSHGNLLASAFASMQRLGHSPQDRWLLCMPQYHVGGLSILLRAALGGTAVVVHAAFDPGRVLRALESERITRLSLVATMLERVLQQSGDADCPPHLQSLLLGGGPAPADLQERALRQRFPVLATYGLTETCSQATTVDPLRLTEQLGTAGPPLWFTDLRIVDEDGRPLAQGEAGEILVRGPTVMQGYTGQPEATAHALRDGWLHTGDIGLLDGDGNLRVLDRRADLIISGGENVYPAEVESALRAFPAVADAVVVARSDARWGQVPVALVALYAPLDEATLKVFLEQRLARFKLPQAIHAVPQVPRSAGGKLLRQAARALVKELEP